MNLRKYHPHDCKEIVELFYNTVHSINIKDYNEAQISAWAPEHIDLAAWNHSLIENYTVIAEENNIIIGFGDLNASGYFDRLFVHMDYQKMGVASLIATKIETFAQKNNIKQITVNASITAKPFFEKRGYTIIRQQAVERRGQTLINYAMEKHLD